MRHLLTSLNVKQRDTIPANEGSRCIDLKMPLLLCCFCLVCSSPYQLKLGVSSVRLDNHSAFLSLSLFIAFFPGKTSCLLFFPGCGQPLGVARGGNSELPDSMMKASSEDYRYPASSGRLKDSGWAPVSSDEDPYPYLQIDLGQPVPCFVGLKFRAVRILTENQPG